MSEHGIPRRFSSPNRPLRLLKAIFIPCSVTGLILVVTALALAAPGDLDPSFGTGGIVLTPGFQPAGMAIQPDGKIVVSGVVSGVNSLVRYNSDGTLDATFGNAGVAPAPDGGRVAFQSDGKIIVGGGLLLVRFNSDGSLDVEFGSSGVAGLPLAVAAVAIDTSNKIVIVGANHRNFAVARFTADGRLDVSFNGTGIAMTEFDHPHFFDEAKDLVIQPDGKIIAVGTAVGTQGGYFPTNFALVRYTVDGSLDNGFGSNGRVLTPLEGTFAGGAVQEPNGKITVIGTGYGLGGRMVRYNSDGSLDLTFGNNGIATNSVMSCNPRGAVRQTDGKIVAVDECAHLIRFLPDGQLDPTFGDGGVVNGIPVQYPYDVGLGLQGDNRLIVVGGYIDGYVARYQLRLFQLDHTVTTLSPDPGQLITYTLTLKNADSYTATQLAISDVIPAGLTWADQLQVDPPISGTLGQPPDLVTDLTLSPWQEITLTMPMTVNLGVADGTIITHSVTVMADQIPLTSTLVITTAGSPVTQDDRALTEKNLPVVINVLGNDWDPNNDVLSLIDVGVPLSGTASLVDNMVVYTPSLDFIGTDTFTYTVSDGRFATPGAVSAIVADHLFHMYIPIQFQVGILPD